MADLRSAVLWLLRIRAPWRVEHLATLAAVPPARAKAYATALAHRAVLQIDASGAITSGRRANAWREEVPKTRPGGNAVGYRRQREVRAELEAADWRLRRAEGALTSEIPQEATASTNGEQNVPSESPLPVGLTLTQAADALQVHPNTIRGWIHDGRLRAERIGPRMIRIPVDEIARLRAPVEARRG